MLKLAMLRNSCWLWLIRTWATQRLATASSLNKFSEILSHCFESSKYAINHDSSDVLRGINIWMSRMTYSFLLLRTANTSGIYLKYVYLKDIASKMPKNKSVIYYILKVKLVLTAIGCKRIRLLFSCKFCNVIMAHPRRACHFVSCRWW